MKEPEGESLPVLFVCLSHSRSEYYDSSPTPQIRRPEINFPKSYCSAFTSQSPPKLREREYLFSGIRGG